MAQKRRTVKQLADEARLDTDAALVTLWDAGFDKVLSASDVIRCRDLNRARRALGLGTRRELETPAYWMAIFDVNETDFNALLMGLGVQNKNNSDKLRISTITRLRGEARRRGIDPVTGISLTAHNERSKGGAPPSSAWRTPGHERELRWLELHEVQAIHCELVNDFASSSDPIAPAGVRSEALLESAVFRPRTSLDRTLKYPTVETSAAALLHSIIHDHPFHNGNKRTALVATLVFLDENGFFPDFDQDDVFKFVLQVAQHRIVDGRAGTLPDQEVLGIADWLCIHCRVLEQGDRQVPYRKLRRILVGYGCEFHGPLGNKVDISRDIVRPGLLHRVFRTGTIQLRTHLSYSGAGREVSRRTIKRIRTDLHLDDLHGIDSHAFYSNEAMVAEDFIAHYRKTLYRLAKF